MVGTGRLGSPLTLYYVQNEKKEIQYRNRRRRRRYSPIEGGKHRINRNGNKRREKLREKEIKRERNRTYVRLSTPAERSRTKRKYKKALIRFVDGIPCPPILAYLQDARLFYTSTVMSRFSLARSLAFLIGDGLADMRVTRSPLSASPRKRLFDYTKQKETEGKKEQKIQREQNDDVARLAEAIPANKRIYSQVHITYT